MDLIERLTGVPASQVLTVAERVADFDWRLTDEQQERVRQGVQSGG